MKKDRWNKPFRKIVNFGESHTAGASATRLEWGWAPLLKQMIDRFQYDPVVLINNGLGADVLSKDCPVYEEYQGVRPIGIERYRKHIIEQDPDLVIISFGYNDMRGGTPLPSFVRDLETVVSDIKNEADCLIVLLDTYFLPEKGFQNPTGGTIVGRRWHNANPAIKKEYDTALREIAKKFDLLFVPVSHAQGFAEWGLADPSGEGDIHANDLGHTLIANKIFEVLATNCSCLAKKALDERQRVGKSPWRYGEQTQEGRIIRDFYPESDAFKG